MSAARRVAMRAGAVFAALVLAAMSSFAPHAVRACGICDDDAVASVYDHALVAHATGRGHLVIFVRPVGGASAPAARAARALRALPEVDAGSVRVSAAPAAVAFTCAPARLAAVLAHAGDRLRRDGIVLRTLRIASSAMGAEARFQ